MRTQAGLAVVDDAADEVGRRGLGIALISSPLASARNAGLPGAGVAIVAVEAEALGCGAPLALASSSRRRAAFPAAPRFDRALMARCGSAGEQCRAMQSNAEQAESAICASVGRVGWVGLRRHPPTEPRGERAWPGAVDLSSST